MNRLNLCYLMAIVAIIGGLTCAPVEPEYNKTFTPQFESPLPQFIQMSETKDTLLSVVVSGTRPYTYRWYKNDILLDTLQTDSTKISYSVKNVQFGHRDVYRVDVENSVGKTSGSTTFIVDSLVYNIQVSSAGRGSISPAGSGGILRARVNTQPSFTYTPEAGNFIDSVIINGSNCTRCTATAQFSFIPMKSNGSIRVVFGGADYILHVAPPINGTIRPTPLADSTFTYGDTITLTAVPNTGYYFGGWQFDASGKDTAYKVTMNSDKKIAALFVNLESIALAASGSHGTIELTPPGGIYSLNATVRLRAIPNAGYRFVAWSDGATGTKDTLTLVMNAAKSVIATFEPITYSLTVSAGTGGSIITPAITSVTINYAVATTITAQAQSGYRFVRWSTDSGSVTFSDSAQASTTVSLKNGNAKIKALFEVVIDTTTYTLTLQKTDQQDTLVPTATVAIRSGVKADITAKPAKGSHFVRWVKVSGNPVFDDSSLASTKVVLSSGDAIIRALTIKDTFSLLLTMSNGTVTQSPAGKTSFLYGDTLRLTASADLLYFFNGWAGDTTVDSSQRSITIRFTRDRTVTANFAQFGSYNLTVSTLGGGAVSKTPDQTSYVSGTNVVVRATPDSVHLFGSWSGDTTGSANPCSVLVKTNKNIVANFTNKKFLLTKQNGVLGTLTTDSIMFGTPFTLTAPNNTGYRFVNWTMVTPGGGTIALDTSLTNAKVTLAKAGAITIKANYKRQYTLTVIAGTGGATATGSGIVDSGATTTISCPPATGYDFVNWTATTGSAAFGSATTNATTATLVSGDATVRANFVPHNYLVTYYLNAGINGNNPSSYNITNGAIPLLSPTKSGYDFGGWFQNPSFTGSPMTSIPPGSTGDIVLYTKWYCIITFDSQLEGRTGASASPSSLATNSITGCLDNLPSDPQKQSYVFDGWYPRGSSTKFATSTIASGTMTVYAKWVIKDGAGNLYTENRYSGQQAGSRTWVWMAQNLRTNRFANGDTIHYTSSNAAWATKTDAGFCWYNNDSNNATTCGGLYNLYTIFDDRELAPPGWHIPTQPEWLEFSNFLEEQLHFDCSGEIAKALASHTNWTTSAVQCAPGNSTPSNNLSGFNAIPGGARDAVGNFIMNGNRAYWWTIDNYCMEIAYNSPVLGYIHDYDYLRGYSIRCLRD